MGGARTLPPTTSQQTMIEIGNTIVYKHGNGSVDFYWLVEIRPSSYIFFDWYANPRKATIDDYWEVSAKRFKSAVEDGFIEIFDSLPMDKYGDVFERQARERNK